MKFLRRLIPNTLMKFGILLSFLGVIIVGLSTASTWWRVAYSSIFPCFWTKIGWGLIVIGFFIQYLASGTDKRNE